MAKLYFLTAAPNTAAAVTDTDDMDARVFPGGGPAGTSSLQFDETTNAALLADLKQNLGLYAVVAGVLKKSGATVTPAADATATADRRFVQANLAAVFTALRAGTATAAQQQRVLAFLLRQFLAG